METDLKEENRLKLKKLSLGHGEIDVTQNDDPAATVGKFLLCRTLETPRVVEGGLGWAMVWVTDPEGNGRIDLSLQHYSSRFDMAHGVDIGDILPEGMYLAVKNPNPDFLICECPAEVELLSPKDVENIMGKGKGFAGCQPPTAFWERHRHGTTLEEEEASFFKQLRTLGNKLFVSNCFSDAVRFYDLALQYASTDEEKSITLSNKAAALLRMRCNNTALNIAKLALDLDPSNAKAVYRMGQAYLRLGMHEEAVKELRTSTSIVSSLLKENDALKEMFEKAEGHLTRKQTPPLTSDEYTSLCKYSKVNHNFTLEEYEAQRSNNYDLLQRMTDDLREFVGPVEVKQCTNAGKGRGLFATQDIFPGEVILISKAISVAQNQLVTTDVKVGCGEGCLEHVVGTIESQMIEVLSTQFANAIRLDSAVGSLVYQLSAGEELGFLRKGDPSSTSVDMERIQGILNINASISINPDHTRPSGRMEYYCKDLGLWFLPSFINHSCSEYNCVFEYYEDVLVVKAVEKISKGNEITRSYVGGDWYEKMQDVNLPLGFTCICKLCTFELKEKNSAIGQRRQKLLDHLKNMSPCKDITELQNYPFTELVSDLKFMEKLWKDRSIPGLFKDGGLHNMSTYFYEAAKESESHQKGWGAPLYKQSLRVERLRFSMKKHGVGKITSIMNIIHHLLKIDKRREVSQYLKMVKEELRLWFGSIEAIRMLFDSAFMQELEEAGINFFET